MCQTRSDETHAAPHGWAGPCRPGHKAGTQPRRSRARPTTQGPQARMLHRTGPPATTTVSISSLLMTSEDMLRVSATPMGPLDAAVKPQ